MSKQSNPSPYESLSKNAGERNSQLNLNNTQLLPNYQTLLYINYHQAYLINQLLKNIQDQKLDKNNNKGQTQQNSSRSQKNDNVEIEEEIDISNRPMIQLQSKEKKIKKRRQIKNAQYFMKEKYGQLKHSQSEQYVPDELLQEDQKQRRFCETKNIAKNFGKAIISFIIKQKALSKKVIAQYGIDEKEFFKKVNQFKPKIVTIYGLRSFWMEETNNFAKPVRILSQFFLRKCSLKHIFYSRVQNFSRNLKYRRSIMQALADPPNFTAIKDD